MISQFILYGPLPSKKNMYKRRGRGPGKGLYIPDEVLAVLDNLRLQLPIELRGAQLKNPDMEIEFLLPTDIPKQHVPWMSDPDGRYTTLLDLFVKHGILPDDNFHNNNGCKLIHPATLSGLNGLDIDETRITLYENGGLMPALRERFCNEAKSGS